MASIRNFAQIETLCKHVLGKCYVRKMGFGKHALGWLEVHLIVGLKVNPNFNPEAKIGLKSEKTEADVRILFVKPGMEEADLIKKLTIIKTDAEKKKVEVVGMQAITDSDKENSMSNEEANKIAARLERGEDVGSGDNADDDISDMIDEFEDENVNYKEKADELGDDGSNSGAGDAGIDLGLVDTDPKEPTSNKFETDVLTALKTLSDSVKGIKKDVDNLKKPKQNGKSGTK